MVLYQFADSSYGRGSSPRANTWISTLKLAYRISLSILKLAYSTAGRISPSDQWVLLVSIFLTKHMIMHVLCLLYMPIHSSIVKFTYLYLTMHKNTY